MSEYVMGMRKTIAMKARTKLLYCDGAKPESRMPHKMKAHGKEDARECISMLNDAEWHIRCARRR